MSSDTELLPGVSLIESKVTSVEENGKYGFIITCKDGTTHQYYCNDMKDRNTWQHAVTTISKNLSEQTMVCSCFFFGIILLKLHILKGFIY